MVAESNVSLSLYSKDSSVAIRGERLTLPMILKPGEMPLGSTLIGEIMDVMPSPVATYKSELLLLKLQGGQDVCFPMTAVIFRALEAKGGAKKLVGRTLAIKKTGVRPKGDKHVNLFDVYLLDGKSGK